MMQHLATQKTELATLVSQANKSVSTDSQANTKGQDFAVLFEQNTAVNNSSTDYVHSSKKLPPKTENSRPAEPVEQVSRDSVTSKQEVAKPDQNPSSTQTQSDSKDEQELQNENDVSNTEARRGDAENTQSQDAKTEDPEVKKATDSEQHSENNVDESQLADENKGKDSSPEELNVDEQIHLDWLAMIDKLKANEEASSAVDEVEQPIRLVLDQLEKNGKEPESSDAAEQDANLIDWMTAQQQSFDDENEMSQQETLSALISKLQTVDKDSPSEQELSEIKELLSSLVEDMGDADLASYPVLKELPELTDQEMTLLAEMLNLTKNEGEQAPQFVPEEPLGRLLIEAEPRDIEQLTEKLTSVIETETRLPEASKSELVKELKASLQEVRSQLEQGKGPKVNLGQLIKEAVNKVTDAEVVPQTDLERLSMMVNKINLTSEAIGQMRETYSQQFTQPIAPISPVASITRDTGSTTPVEMLRQTAQQAVQMERAINITKPEATQQLADKVQLMVNQKNMVAEIRLDPPDLGAMKIKLNLQGDAANVNFVVQSQQAREVLEQATPRLKELLSEQGIELGQSTVEQQAQEQKGDGESGQLAGGNSAEPEQEAESNEQSHTLHMVNGSLNGIDYFA